MTAPAAHFKKQSESAVLERRILEANDVQIQDNYYWCPDRLLEAASVIELLASSLDEMVNSCNYLLYEENMRLYTARARAKNLLDSLGKKYARV